MDIVYRAFDGTMFNNENECVKYENSMATWINDIYWSTTDILSKAAFVNMPETFHKVTDLQALNLVINHAYALYIASEVALKQLQILHREGKLSEDFDKTGLWLWKDETAQFIHQLDLIQDYDDEIKEILSIKAEVQHLAEAFDLGSIQKKVEEKEITNEN